MTANRDKTLKRTLKEGGTVIGTLMNFTSTTMIRYAGDTGFDFVIIDNEHGPMGIETTESMVVAAEAANIVPLVRVASNELAPIMHTLDVGACGIHIPQINNKEDARRAVRHARFAPLGTRGLALSVRANRFGSAAADKFIRQSNEETLIVAQIETEEGMRNLDDILTVEGLDVIFIGPIDLSHSLGIVGQFDNEAFVNAVDEIFSRAREAGKILGIYVSSPEDAHKWIGRGVQYICTGSAGLIRNACEGFVRGVRNHGA